MFIGYNTPFFILIATAFVFLGLQFIGGDHDVDGDFDLDGDLDAPGGLGDILGFINIGRVPLSLVLMLFSFCWGALGLLYNSFWLTLWSSYSALAFALCFSASGLSAVLCTRLGSQLLANVFQDTSAASRPEDFIGCVGTVISGRVPGFTEKGIGRARVYNEHGVLLQIACIAHEDASSPQKHQRIFVTDYDPERRLYQVMPYESPEFYDYTSGHLEAMKRFDHRLQQSLKHQQHAEPLKENE